MMGHRQVEQAALFYEFSLERHVPADHLLRSIDRFVHDRTAIHDVVRIAFDRAAEAVLVDQLRADGDNVVSLVAIDHVEIIGHVMLSTMKAPFKALGLAPVSVRPNRQRAGVGSSLVQEALIQAQQGGWDAVFVLGDPRFYRRFGFDPELASGFTSPYAGRHLMVLPMQSSLPATAEKIGYASAFEAIALSRLLALS